MEELQGRMSQAEYLRWIAFADHEPIGAERGDVRAAMQMMLTVAVNRKKGSKKPKLSQFMPDWWDEKKRPAALAAKFRALVPSATTRDDIDELTDTEDTDAT